MKRVRKILLWPIEAGRKLLEVVEPDGRRRSAPTNEAAKIRKILEDGDWIDVPAGSDIIMRDGHVVAVVPADPRTDMETAKNRIRNSRS